MFVSSLLGAMWIRFISRVRAFDRVMAAHARQNIGDFDARSLGEDLSAPGIGLGLVVFLSCAE